MMNRSRMPDDEPDASVTHVDRTEELLGDVTVGRDAGTGSSDLEDAVQGIRLGRYILLERLGQGAMGKVYLAYDPDLARQVAVKVLRRAALSGGDLTRDPKRRFLREAQAAAQLVHPHVVGVYEAGVDDGVSFIAMEYVKGTTLKDAMRGGSEAPARPWRELLDLFIQAGEGIAAAHAADILHRDFKPDNVLIDRHGRAKVADFGLASRASTPPGADSATAADPGQSLDSEAYLSSDGLDAKLTTTGSVMGTPAYMAPEQHRTSRVDARADVYAFCASLFEGLYGERPFPGDTLRKVYRAKMAGAPGLPDRGARVPRWLGEVVRQGLEPDPERRPGSMRALLDGIERARHRSVRRRWLMVGGLVAVAVGGLLLGRKLDKDQRVAACETRGAVIDDSWSAEARRAMADGMRSSEAVDVEATIERVEPWLDRYADQWRERRVNTCLAATVERDPLWGPESRTKADWCFEARRLEFEGLVETLTKADAAMVTYAVSAAAGLGDLGACADPVSVRHQVVPAAANEAEIVELMGGLSRVDALAAVAAYEEAWALADALRSRAAEIGWAPLLVGVDRRRGYLAVKRGDYEQAEKLLEQAYFDGVRVEANYEALTAAEELSFLLAEFRARPEDGMRWSKHAAALLERLADPGELHRASNLNNRGVIEEFLRDFDASIAHHRESVAIRERELGAEHPDVARGLSNLASALRWKGDDHESLELFAKSIEIKERALGPEHPSVAMGLNNHGIMLREVKRYEEAEAQLRRALAIREHVYGREHTQVASGLNNLAIVLMSRDKLPEAQAAYRRSIEIWRNHEDGRHPELVLNLSNLGHAYMRSDDDEEARESLRAALDLAEAILEKDDPNLAYPLSGLATLAGRADDHQAAEDYLRRALEVRKAAYGESHFMVASTLELIGERQRVRGALEQARATLEVAVPMFEATSGADSERLDGSLSGLVEIALAQGQPERAVVLARRRTKLAFEGETANASRARAEFQLARALDASAPGSDEATSLAERARQTLAENAENADAAVVTEIDAWLAERV